MEKTQNRISSPEATGGAGPTFEQKLGVYWLVQLLVGCIPPIFVDSVVERVAFQTEHLGWNTDDLLITCANGAGHPLVVHHERLYLGSSEFGIAGVCLGIKSGLGFSKLLLQISLVIVQRNPCQLPAACDHRNLDSCLDEW